MPEDPPHPRRTATPDAERHFEMPRLVREITPGSGPPAAEGGADESSSSSSSPEGAVAIPSDGQAWTGERPLTSELSAAFQRRWETVQTVFVAGGGRGRRIGRGPLTSR